jgi:hypothetical protein
VTQVYDITSTHQPVGEVLIHLEHNVVFRNDTNKTNFFLLHEHNNKLELLQVQHISADFMSFKVNKFCNKVGATRNNNLLQDYYPVFCYRVTSTCKTMELYVYLLMNYELRDDIRSIMTDCYRSPNRINKTGSVNIRIEPTGCWSKRPGKEYEQPLNFSLDENKQFILNWGMHNCLWSCTIPFLQDSNTSITVYFDNVKNQEIFNNRKLMMINFY